MDKNRIIEEYLQGKHPIEQESWELPSAQELERDEALFDSLTPRPLRVERGLKRRVFPLSWRGIGGGLIAASIVLLLVFHFTQKPVEEQLVVAEVVEPENVEQPAPESSESSEISEPSEYPDNSEPSEPIKPIKPKRTRKVRAPQAEPLLAEAEPMTEKTEAEPLQEETKQEIKSSVSPAPTPSEDFDLHLLAAAQAQDIRSRGKRLSQEVALLMEH